MNTIAIVDDRADARGAAQRRIERGLGKLGATGEWRVLGIDPLPELDDYPSWLTGEEVLVLILDQRLNEDVTKKVSYNGHDIVTRIRPRLFDLPVYYLTAVADDEEVEGDAPKVQAILERKKFLDSDPVPWVREFMREGQRYEQKLARNLARLSELAEKAVSGILSEDEAEEAASLRQTLQLAFESGDDQEEARTAARSELLDRFEGELDALEEAVQEFRAILEAASNTNQADEPSEDES